MWLVSRSRRSWPRRSGADDEPALDRAELVLVGDGLHEPFLAETAARVLDCLRGEAGLPRDPRVERVGFVLGVDLRLEDVEDQLACVVGLRDRRRGAHQRLNVLAGL